MKPISTLAGALVLTLGACRAPTEQGYGNELVGGHNLWTARATFEEAAQAAVIREHTLYAHHFEPDAAALNQLGQRDVRWLAQHYLANPFGLPVSLNVRCAGVSEALYQERLESVRAAFEQQGLDASLLAIEDGLPGGDGLASARVHAALSAEPAPLSDTMSTTAASGVMLPFGSER
jgi:hypothetical protein